MDSRQFMKTISISDSRSVENILDKISKIEVQPAQTNGVERVKGFVNVDLIASSETWKGWASFDITPLENFMWTLMLLLQSNKDSVVMHQLSNFICLGLK